MITPVQKSQRLGNQQGNKNMNYTNQLAWLAGIIEGEANVGIYTHKRGDGTYKIAPMITIVNTDPHIINQAEKIIRKMGVVPYIRAKPFDKNAWNTCYTATLHNLNDIKIVLEATVGMMVGQKKAISQLTLRFINSRLSKTKTGVNGKYTDTEKTVYAKVREMTRRGVDKKFVPPETIREKPFGYDIVRTHGESVRSDEKSIAPAKAE